MIAENTALLSAAATGTEEAVALVTAYTDRKVPVISMVMTVFCAVMVVAAAIAGIVYVARRFRNWGPAAIAGILAELLFCYLLYAFISFGLSKIPALQPAIEALTPGYRAIQYLMTMLLTVLGICLGMIYALKNTEKKQTRLGVGVALGFVAAFLIATVMQGGTVSTPLQYVMISAAVNSSGFDTVCASMVESGYTEEEAIEALLSLLDWDWFAFFCNYLSIICTALVDAGLAVLVYGVYTGRLEKKQLLMGLSGVILFWIPGFINLFVTFPTWLILAVMLLLTAVNVRFVIQVLREKLPDDWRDMKAKGQGNLLGRVHKPQEPPKMPKIKMPD